MSDTRKRNYATILYEESVADDFINLIESWHVPAFLSPLHDRDVKDTGELKKAHWHLMLMFEGKKSPEQVYEDFIIPIQGVGCEPVNSIGGMARYLCHLDNKDKAQYSPSDVLSFAGADYATCCLLLQDRDKELNAMKAFCKKYNVLSLAELTDYADKHNDTWSTLLNRSCQVVMLHYIQSLQWEQEHNYSRSDIDKITEEGGI